MRFGRCATTPTLHQQAIDAIDADIGIPSPLRPDAEGNRAEAPPACRAAPGECTAEQDGRAVAGGSLDLVTCQTSTLTIPKRDDADDS